MARTRVLILGGGYGGLACLRALAADPEAGRWDLRLLDVGPYHTIKTRFHERAVLESRDPLLRLPLRTLAAAAGAEFAQDRVVSLDLPGRRVQGDRGDHPYDRLVIALGGHIAYFGVPGAAEHTVSLQTYEDACRCAARLQQLRIGEASSPRRRVVVCGAGVEGLEVAAMLRAVHKPEHCEVTVVERSDALMARSQCKEKQRAYLRRTLESKDVQLRLGATIAGIEADAVQLEGGERLAADLVYWCAGVRRVEIGGLPLGEPFLVSPALQLPGHPEVFALGDFATVDSEEPFANLASAQRAVIQGPAVAANLARLERGEAPVAVPYRPIGELIGLGDGDGVGIIRGVGVTGLAAATAKKGNEAKYLAEVWGQLPGALARGIGYRLRRLLS